MRNKPRKYGELIRKPDREGPQVREGTKLTHIKAWNQREADEGETVTINDSVIM